MAFQTKVATILPKGPRTYSRSERMNYPYRPTTSSISFGGPLTPTVKRIIIACIVVFVMQIISGGLRGPITGLFSLTPSLVIARLYLWQLFTYIFLHGSVFHLLINMLILFMFGCELERNWGRRSFWKYFLVTGIGAGICITAVNFFSYQGSTLGASGAIYGVLLAYGLTFPDRIIHVMLFFPLPAKYAVIIFGGIAFLSTLSDSMSGVSHTAHLAGMLVGYIYLKGPFYRNRPGTSWYEQIKDAYLEYKFRRARKSFEVYLNRKERRRRNNDTIH